jgi:glycosyltransferase involved in cell wall biosynthesis
MSDSPANSFVSILLPFRNADSVLQRAVDSIVNQDYDFELILIENQENESLVAQRLAEVYSFIKLIREPRPGIVQALNTGLKHCTGEFIARMDADDEMFPRRLKRQAEFLSENPEIIVVSGRILYHGDGLMACGYSAYVDQLNSIQTPAEIRKYRFIESPIAHPSVMFRKSAIDREPLYREGNFPEDYELWLHWLEKHPNGMAKISDDVLIWHDSETRLSRNHPAYREESFMLLRLEYLLRYLKTEKTNKRILVAGVGKKARKKIRIIQAAGLTIHAITDLRQRKFDDLPFISWDELPAPGEYFLVSLVSNRGSWREIEAHLRKFGYRNEVDYILAT